MHFDHIQDKILIFDVLHFTRDLRRTKAGRGARPLQFVFECAYLFMWGHVEHLWTMLKTFSIKAPPYSTLRNEL